MHFNNFPVRFCRIIIGSLGLFLLGCTNASVSISSLSLVPLKTSFYNLSPVNMSNSRSYVVSGECGFGTNFITATMIDTNFNSMNLQIPCLERNFSATLDLSGLSDGNIDFTLTPDSGFGESKTILKDTIPPNINGLANDSSWFSTKQWSWGCSEDCSYRYVVGASAESVSALDFSNSTTTSYSSASSGEFFLSIEAQDVVGNITFASYSTQIDVTPPAAPTAVFGPSTSNSLTQSPTITFSTGTDLQSGVSHHQVRVKESLSQNIMSDWQTIANGSPAMGLSLQANTHYFLEIRAVDQVGNVSSIITSDGWLVMAGPFSLDQSTITVSSSSLAIGATSILLLQARDASGIPIIMGGLNIGFYTYDGTSAGAISAVTDNGNGTYSATFTATGSGTPVKIGATIGGAAISSTPIPEIEVLPEPLLSIVTASTNASTPLAPGSFYFFDINNSRNVPVNDSGMAYTCVFDRTLDAVISGSTNCTTLPGTPTFNSSTGVFNWMIPLSAVGPYELRVTGCSTNGCDHTFVELNVKQAYPTTGLIADLDAQFAEGLVSPGQNIPLTTTFRNLAPGFALLDAVLTPDMQSSNPWLGNGTTVGNGSITAAGPFRINFNGSSQYLDLSTTLSAMPASVAISTWTRPSNIASSANGSVMISNGEMGIEVMQSSSQNGKIELAVAGMRPWDSVQPSGGPFIHYKLNETTLTNGSPIMDSSGNGRHGTLRIFQPSGTWTSTPSAISGETDPSLRSEHLTQNNGNVMISDTAFPMSGFQQFSFELWFRTDVSHSRGGMLMGFGSSSASDAGDANHDRKMWMDNAGRIYFAIWNGSVIREINTFGAYNDGNWHHVVGMYDYLADTSGRISLYIDGGNGTTLGTPIVLNNTGLAQTNYSAFIKIGSGTPWRQGASAAQHSDRHFEGYLDEVTIWNRTLSAAEVVARAKSRTCRSTTTFANNTFYNVAATFDNSTRVGKLYVNGLEECSQTYPTGTSIVSGLPLTLGARPITASTYTRFWSGGVGEIKVYNTATPGISAIHSTTAPRYP